jgi:hypothetical protein
MKISLSEIKAIGDDLAKRNPTPDSVREMPIKEVVMTLAPELSRMVSRGFTTADLLAVLKEHKISVTGRTLNNYLKEFREGRRESRKRGKKTDSLAANPAPSSCAVPQTAGNLFTPSEERKVASAAPGVPGDGPWREQLKDLG